MTWEDVKLELEDIRESMERLISPVASPEVFDLMGGSFDYLISNFRRLFQYKRYLGIIKGNIDLFSDQLESIFQDRSLMDDCFVVISIIKDRLNNLADEVVFGYKED